MRRGTVTAAERAFFAGHADALAIFRAVKREVATAGPFEARVSRSQVGFTRKHPFAATWRPAQHLGGDRPPLVLTIHLRRRDPSRRWKEVVEPAPGRFTHHLELHAPADVDGEVGEWLAEAWREAG